MGHQTFLRDRPPFRGLAFTSLRGTAEITRGTFAQTGGGEAVRTMGTAATVRCRLSELSGGEAETAGQIVDRSTHLLVLPAGTDVRASDQAIVVGRGTWEVTAVRQADGELVRKVEVVEA